MLDRCYFRGLRIVLLYGHLNVSKSDITNSPGQARFGSVSCHFCCIHRLKDFMFLVYKRFEMAGGA